MARRDPHRLSADDASQAPDFGVARRLGRRDVDAVLVHIQAHLHPDVAE